MDLDNRIDGPATGNCIDDSIDIVAEPLAATEWNVINRIRAEDMLGVEIARRVVSSGIIEVLEVGVRRNTLGRSPSAVIPAVIGHALRKGIRDLVFQPAGIALLKHRLQ